jgi:hypothetical protein
VCSEGRIRIVQGVLAAVIPGADVIFAELIAVLFRDFAVAQSDIGLSCVSGTGLGKRRRETLEDGSSPAAAPRGGDVAIGAAVAPPEKRNTRRSERVAGQ